MTNITQDGEQASSLGVNPIRSVDSALPSMMAPNSNSSRQRKKTSRPGVPQDPFPDVPLPPHMVAGNRRSKRKTDGNVDSTMTASATPRHKRTILTDEEGKTGLPNFAAPSTSLDQQRPRKRQRGGA